MLLALHGITPIGARGDCERRHDHHLRRLHASRPTSARDGSLCGRGNHRVADAAREAAGISPRHPAQCPTIRPFELSLPCVLDASGNDRLLQKLHGRTRANIYCCRNSCRSMRPFLRALRRSTRRFTRAVRRACRRSVPVIFLPASVPSWASASDTVSTVGAAVRLNAAASPIRERAFRREITSNSLMFNTPGLGELSYRTSTPEHKER